jgi:hypothetical protein
LHSKKRTHDIQIVALVILQSTIGTALTEKQLVGQSLQRLNMYCRRASAVVNLNCVTNRVAQAPTYKLSYVGIPYLQPPHQTVRHVPIVQVHCRRSILSGHVNRRVRRISHVRCSYKTTTASRIGDCVIHLNVPAGIEISINANGYLQGIVSTIILMSPLVSRAIDDDNREHDDEKRSHASPHHEEMKDRTRLFFGARASSCTLLDIRSSLNAR